jgi:hypothetical protein
MGIGMTFRLLGAMLMSLQQHEYVQYQAERECMFTLLRDANMAPGTLPRRTPKSESTGASLRPRHAKRHGIGKSANSDNTDFKNAPPAVTLDLALDTSSREETRVLSMSSACTGKYHNETRPFAVLSAGRTTLFQCVVFSRCR